MNAAHWQLVQDLFESALALPPAERHTFLKANCADEETAELLAEMLEADNLGSSVLDQSVQHLAGGMLAQSDSSASSSVKGFGAYRLVRLLGEGGMGVVWLAERTDTEGQVAVKFLPGAWLSPARRDRFMQEVRLLAKLSHPGIACLYDAGTLRDGTPWFAMEYVDGRSFTEYCSDVKSLTMLLQLFSSVCEAVQHAHNKGVIHRDLKPSNLMVSFHGTPKLLDFGIASELDRASSPSGLTAMGMRFASPPFSAPEYIQDGAATAMSDVYSLGVILYGLLIGHPMTNSGTGTAQSATHATLAEFKPSIAVRQDATFSTSSMTDWQRSLHKISQSEWNDLDVLCLKATHSDAVQRYQSVEALIRDIQHFLRGEPLEGRPDSWSYRGSKFLRRNALAVIASTATLFVLLTMAVVFTVRLAKARNVAMVQAARADRVQQFMLGLFANSGKLADAPGSLTVEALVDRGVVEAVELKRDPTLQAELYATLAQMYTDIGRLAKAEALYSKALDIEETQPGFSIGSRVDIRLKLGRVVGEEGKQAQLKSMVAETIQLIAEKAPKDRISKLKADSEWAAILRAEGKYKEAEQLLKTIVGEQELSGAPKADLVETLIYLSGVEIFLGHYTEADLVNKELVSICENSPLFTLQMGDAIQNLGETAEVEGRYVEAEQYERQAISLATAWYGEDHIVLANKKSALAATLIDEKKYAEADALLQDVLAKEERFYPPTSMYLSKTWKSIGMLQMALGKYDAALVSFDHVQSLYRENHLSENYLVGRTYIFQGLALLGKNDLPRAEELFRTALQMLYRVRGETDIYTARAHLNLGHTLLLEKRYEEAEVNLQVACKTFKALSMEQTEFMQQGRTDLAAIHDALHQPMGA